MVKSGSEVYESSSNVSALTSSRLPAAERFKSASVSSTVPGQADRSRSGRPRWWRASTATAFAAVARYGLLPDGRKPRHIGICGQESVRRRLAGRQRAHAACAAAFQRAVLVEVGPQTPARLRIACCFGRHVDQRQGIVEEQHAQIACAAKGPAAGDWGPGDSAPDAAASASARGRAARDRLRAPDRSRAPRRDPRPPCRRACCRILQTERSPCGRR